MTANLNKSATSLRALATVQEVAAYLSLSRSKVYQLMDDGALPHVKLGKCRRIRWADVDALVEQSRIGGSSL
jgi:excisionase family DNA binding protein